MNLKQNVRKTFLLGEWGEKFLWQSERGATAPSVNHMFAQNHIFPQFYRKNGQKKGK